MFLDRKKDNSLKCDNNINWQDSWYLKEKKMNKKKNTDKSNFFFMAFDWHVSTIKIYDIKKNTHAPDKFSKQ